MKFINRKKRKRIRKKVIQEPINNSKINKMYNLVSIIKITIIMIRVTIAAVAQMNQQISSIQEDLAITKSRVFRN